MAGNPTRTSHFPLFFSSSLETDAPCNLYSPQSASGTPPFTQHSRTAVRDPHRKPHLHPRPTRRQHLICLPRRYQGALPSPYSHQVYGIDTDRLPPAFRDTLVLGMHDLAFNQQILDGRMIAMQIPVSRFSSSSPFTFTDSKLHSHPPRLDEQGTYTSHLLQQFNKAFLVGVRMWLHLYVCPSIVYDVHILQVATDWAQRCVPSHPQCHSLVLTSPSLYSEGAESTWLVTKSKLETAQLYAAELNDLYMVHLHLFRLSSFILTLFT
jgi:hypothetical protein